MTDKVRKNGKKRMILKWWQKLLLILVCTGLCVLGAWLLCEKTLEPSYVDTVQATMEIDRDAMDIMKSQESEFLEDILEIYNSMDEEQKGHYYVSLYNVIAGDEKILAEVANHRDIGSMISVSVTGSAEDDALAVVQLDNSGDQPLENEHLMKLVKGVYDQLNNAGIEIEKKRFTEYYLLNEDVSAGTDPALYTENDLRLIDNLDKTKEKGDVWVIKLKLKNRDSIPEAETIRGLLAEKLSAEYEKYKKYALIGDDSTIKDLNTKTLVVNSEDGTHQTTQFIFDNKGSLTNECYRQIIQAAGEKFGQMIFGENPTGEQMTVTTMTLGTLKDEENRELAKNDRYLQYEWVEADPADPDTENRVWIVAVNVSKAAVDALPNRGSFYKQKLDLQSLLGAYMTDDDYRRIAAAAGADAKPEELRKKISFPMTVDEKILQVNVTWGNGQEEAGKIAAAAANQAAAVIIRTLHVEDRNFIVRAGERQYAMGINYDPNAQAENPPLDRWEALSTAGAYVQSFYSDRPQFKTEMTLTAQTRELGLTEYFRQATAKDGTYEGFFDDLAKAWNKKEILSAEGQEAYAGMLDGNSPYQLAGGDIQKEFALEDSEADVSGRTVLIHANTEKIVAFIRQKIEEQGTVSKNSFRTKLEEGEIDEETFEKAVGLLEGYQSTLLDAVGGITAHMGNSIVQKLDVMFFGYAEDKESWRTVSTDAGVITYAVTEEGLDHLQNACYSGEPKENVSLETAIANLDSDNGYQKILDGADTSGTGDVLKNSIQWTETEAKDGVNIRINWSDRTTTGEVGKSAMTVLSRILTEKTDGRALRLVIEPKETKILREQARENPPATLPTMVIVGLIALVLSYIIFSGKPLFDSLVIIFFVIFTFICVFPFYYLLINTISDNTKVAAGRINFLPEGIHFRNYDRILGRDVDGTFKNPDVITSIGVTLARTILGTALMVLTSAWAGYLVTKRKMWHRSFWYRALVITMYFNAGLIPWYTNMLMLGLTNNFLAYIIPGMVAPYNIILVKTYIESIPGSLEESAIIDGASTTKVFLRIILPLSIPILATIAIFGAVGNWNSFQDSLLLMGSAPNLYTLQHRLYIYLNQTTSINTEQISEQMAQNLMNNGVTTKYTIAMVTIIPILLVYPVMQRYFVKGIMLGAVKG